MTPPNIPFTPDPRREYQDLCEQHDSLSAYIEREGPEMRASGQHAELEELERLEAAMHARINELYAQGASVGSAEGQS